MLKIFRKINKSSDKSLRSKGTARLVSGFTLIEIMVSISIFSMIMLIIIGALITLNNANKKAQAMRAVVDNLNFAIDDMTRSIRTGKDFKCGLLLNDNTVSGSAISCDFDRDTKPGISTLAFTGMQNEVMGGEVKKVCYLYSFKPNPLIEGRGSISYGSEKIGEGEDCADKFTSMKTTTFVSPEVWVSGLKFFVFDENTMPYTNQQPIVVIVLSGDINVDKYNFKTPFNIQTTVSQRGVSF